jgi:hypothetical protein
MRLRFCWIVLVCACAFSSQAQDSKSVEVAPGITLPADGDATVFALDTGPNGPVLSHIKPSEVIGVSHATTNFLRSMVYAGPHMSFEVEGPHAQIVLASTKAVFFVRLAGEDAEIMRTRVHLLWLQPGKKRREITDFSTNVFGGQHTRNVDEVPSNTEVVPGTNWLKVTPKDPLLPGEFAVAFLPKDVNQQPDLVYDFSVSGNASTTNPYASGQAGANPDAKKP